jgi:hypothetical protein
MTNFFFRRHGLVFIHIHKAGGTSIRKSLGGKVSSASGYMPSEWLHHPSFAVVRDPVTRFLSAINMFRCGVENGFSTFHDPQLPDLTVAQALDILEDNDVPFDRSINSTTSRLKHHLLQQTHPYNCLHYAKNILRFENLNTDFKCFSDKCKLSVDLPQLGSSRKSPNMIRYLDLSGEDLSRIGKLYRSDFVQLGYNLPLTKSADDKVMERKMTDPWPKLRFHLAGKEIEACDHLPDPEADLNPLMAAIVTVDQGRTWAGRKRNLTEHFLNLEPEFHGVPRLAHVLACVIVVLRRDPNDIAARRLFQRITTEHGSDLAKLINLRWLTSVCDTFMDVAENSTDRATALAGVLLANTIKLAETERRLFLPRQQQPPCYSFSKGGLLFDGVITYWIDKGDMIINMLRRAATFLEDGGVAAPFVAEIVSRMLDHDTVWRRLMALRGQPSPAMAPQEIAECLQRLLSGNLDPS